MGHARTPTCLHNRCLAACAVLLCAVAGARAGEKVYRGVRIPWTNKDNVLASEMVAEQADALELTEKRQRINFSGGVTILVYDLDNATEAALNGDAPLPRKIKITAPGGFYTQVETRGLRERVAQLDSGEDTHGLKVRIERYLYPDGPGGPSVLDAVIQCNNARWSHSKQVLTGTGPVIVTRAGTRLRGTDFEYHVGKEDGAGLAPFQANDPEAAAKGNPSGWIELKRDVRMEYIQDEPALGMPKTLTPAQRERLTIITCKGLAAYDLDTHVVHFQKQVEVTRETLRINSAFLRVLMEENEKKQETVKTIVAWNDVIIRGTTDNEKSAYIAQGDRAEYDTRSEELVLADRRPGKRPFVIFEKDRIEDAVIRFNTQNRVLKALKTAGGQGRASFYSEADPKESKDPAGAVQTVVTYKKSLFYWRDRNRAIFEGDVHLTRADLQVEAQKLLVETETVPRENGKTREGIETVTAEDNVVIRRDNKIATATRAVLRKSGTDAKDAPLHELELYGPPGDAPPFPTVEETGAFRLIGRGIKTEQIGTDAVGKAVNRTVAQGPGSVHFLTEGRRGAAPDREQDFAGDAKAVKVTYQKTATHDEAKMRVHFDGGVTATTEDYVGNSKEMDVQFRRLAEAAPGGEVRIRKKISRIAATGEASLIWGRRHCKASRIVRDMDRGIVTFYGTPQPDGRYAADATVWIEGGNKFRAPIIVAQAEGGRIDADGPGELILPEADDKAMARVLYADRATYTETPAGNGKAVFHKSVILTRGEMKVRGEAMTAHLARELAGDAEAGGAAATERMPQRLRRIQVKQDVVVTRKLQKATGAEGEVFIPVRGEEIIILRGDKEHNADVYDGKGVKVMSPEVTVKQSTGIVTARGPGQVDIASMEALQGQRDDPNATRRQVDYRMLFDGELVYNELARKIKFDRNVRFRQENVKGRCDHLVLNLLEAPLVGEDDTTTGALEVESLDAEGNVIFQRFAPDPHNRHKDVDVLDRPGRTIFTTSQEAHYDVATQIAELFGGPPRPKALQQTVKYGPDDIQRSRFQLSGDRIYLDVPRGRVTAKPRPHIDYLPSSGPMRFKEE